MTSQIITFRSIFGCKYSILRLEGEGEGEGEGGKES
jgi:hypothetical protein